MLGKRRRDELLKHKRISEIDFLPDFLPERPYKFNGVKAIPRRGTHDFYMLFIPREGNLRSHFKMYPGETFVDVGADVGSYTLMIAEEYKTKGVRVIAVEAHPENHKALCRNVECNNFRNIKTVNRAVSDTKGVVTMYKQNDTQRSRSGQYTSLLNALVTSNGTPCEVECNTLDDILT
jgi:FkbM family methyltransferase